jgi:hypothetical protein
MAPITDFIDLTLDEAKARAIDFLSDNNIVEVRPTGDHRYAARITRLDTAAPPGADPGPGGPGPQPPPPTERGFPTGDAILEIAKRHVGQSYGHAPPDYTEALWKGEFDCAEFTSYCAFRAYRILFGTRPKGSIAKADAYTGYWREDVQTVPGVSIPWQEALRTPGAFVLRFPPGSGQMGHIGICIGDGEHIFEAHSTKLGVIRGTATGRRWDVGVKLPGVSYKGGAVVAGGGPAAMGNVLVFRLLNPLAGFNETVQQLQQALQAKGFLTAHDVNGIYDERTSEAVGRFQETEGLLVDGEIGPDTGKALLGEAKWKAVEDQEDETDVGLPAAADHDLLIMARTIFGEARGEPNEGREAVGNVIVNRSRSGRYPNNVASVCLQPFQFSCWNKNDPNRAKIIDLTPGSSKVFDECLAAADRVIRGVVPDATSGALHYYSKEIKQPSWVASSPKARMTAEIGVHRFYIGIK